MGKTRFALLAVGVGLLSPTAAYAAYAAWDRFVPATGVSSTGATVGDIQVSGGGHFRFQLGAGEQLCTTGILAANSWGEISVNDDPGNNEMPVSLEAYKAMVGLMTSAKLAGRKVWIASYNGTAGNKTGYGCRVTAVTMK